MDDYLIDIDNDCSNQLDLLMRKISGDYTIAANGVQIGDSSNILITKSKGPITQFLGLIQLRDQVHVTEAES